MTKIKFRLITAALAVSIAAFLGAAETEAAGMAKVSWTAPTTNVDSSPLTDLAGYIVYYDTTSHSGSCPSSYSSASPYSSMLNVTSANATSKLVTGLTEGQTYYFAVVAYDSSHNMSGCATGTGGATEVTKIIKSNSPVFRFWSSSKQGHFYTMSASERDNIIASDPSWAYEGPAYSTLAANDAETSLVYRFWSDSKQHHFFTISEAEKNHIMANDPSWSYEGVAYYAYAQELATTKPVYRFWSNQKQGHFFTTSATEKDNIMNNDPSWAYEGVAWYVPNQ